MSAHTAHGLWRWAGGKTRILTPLFKFLSPTPVKYRQWIVPFFGGGADATEALRRDLATTYIFSDRLVDVMLAATRWRRVAKTLRHMLTQPEVVQKHYYYWIRSQDVAPTEPETFPEWAEGTWPPLQEDWAAFRLLYMQATCFNGIWRQNKKGKCNVPFGRKGTISWKVLVDFAELLAKRQVEWFTADFEVIVGLAATDDLVYADPPYLQTHDYGGVFKLADHVRLNNAALAARARGATPWVSGSDTEATRSIYTPRKIHVLNVPRSISCTADARGMTTELLMEF